MSGEWAFEATHSDASDVAFGYWVIAKLLPSMYEGDDVTALTPATSVQSMAASTTPTMPTTTPA